jgi:hypothetical protein
MTLVTHTYFLILCDIFFPDSSLVLFCCNKVITPTHTLVHRDTCFTVNNRSFGGTTLDGIPGYVYMTPEIPLGNLHLPRPYATRSHIYTGPLVITIGTPRFCLNPP